MINEKSLSKNKSEVREVFGLVAACLHLAFSVGKRVVFRRNVASSALNNEILDLSLFSVFVCQMDLILNLPLQSYLFCFFVSVKHIIWMQQWDYFMGIILTTIDAPQRKMKNEKFLYKKCVGLPASLKKLFSAAWCLIRVCVGNLFSEFTFSVFNSDFFRAQWDGPGDFQSWR